MANPWLLRRNSDSTFSSNDEKIRWNSPSKARSSQTNEVKKQISSFLVCRHPIFPSSACSPFFPWNHTLLS
uniref:Uncharacterized protein n=1 Tax=Nephroselmis olivacea TaxID=31312 RepID=Q9T2Y7_NEPOL|nr:hypothetical protein NeolCp111 [Nephroselmis olivacea]NP_050931.1 hypothetical protein NeolCp126 [Nephroselmis olivacea]AAD54887.1 unknown [Nephroselmis olivacea]AAD54902.1 unknown [Nephroselmis olivacea]